jgi:hypothetical protein
LRTTADALTRRETTMRDKPFTVTKEFARELTRINDRMSGGHWVPMTVVRQQMLDDMATELRRLARAFARTGRGGKDLLEKLVITEVEGVDAKILTKIRLDLGQRVTKRQAA